MKRYIKVRGISSEHIWGLEVNYSGEKARENGFRYDFYLCRKHFEKATGIKIPPGKVVNIAVVDLDKYDVEGWEVG